MRIAATFTHYSTLLLFAFLSGPAAASECPRLYSAIQFIGDRPPKLTETEYDRHMSELAKKLRGLKPPKFGVYLGVDEPEYSQQANAVFSPSNFFRSEVSGKKHDAKYELAILDHEIGHAVYEANFAYPELGLTLIRERVSAFASKLADLDGQFAAVMKAPVPFNEKAALTREIENRAITVLKDYLALRRTEWMSLGFRELFSDLVASINSRDPKINEKAVRAYVWLKRVQSGQPFEAQFRSRSMNRQWTNPEIMELWKTVDDPRDLIGEPHSFFAPIRSVIWRAIEHRLSTPEADEVLARIFRIITDFEHELLPTAQSYTQFKVDPGEINLELMRRIQKEFDRSRSF